MAHIARAGVCKMKPSWDFASEWFKTGEATWMSETELPQQVGRLQVITMRNGNIRVMPHDEWTEDEHDPYQQPDDPDDWRSESEE